MTGNVFTPHTEPQAEPTLRRNLELPKGVLQKNLKTFVYLGAALLVIVAALFSSSGKKTPAQQAAAKGQPPQPTLQDNTDSNVQELKNQLQAERQKENSRRQWPPPRWEIRHSHLRLPNSGLQPRPMGRPVLPHPVFRASPARKRRRATCRCNSRRCNSRRR